MMKKQKQFNRLLKSKLIKPSIALLIVIGVVVVLSIKSYKSPVQRKLIGTWTVEIEKCRVSNRDWNWTLNTIDVIDKNRCRMPTICDEKTTTEKRWEEATGKWKVISSDPDSVFFDVPKNPLYGKYAIRFFIDNNGYRNMSNNIYKIELKNDSTYLICNKGGILYKGEVQGWADK